MSNSLYSKLAVVLNLFFVSRHPPPWVRNNLAAPLHSIDVKLRNWRHTKAFSGHPRMPRHHGPVENHCSKASEFITQKITTVKCLSAFDSVILQFV